MRKEALYEDGHLIFLDRDLPLGRMKVTVDFPDDEIEELSDEWKAEINRRMQEVKDGKAVLLDGEKALNDLMKELKEK
jgi:hypothetical protein